MQNEQGQLVKRDQRTLKPHPGKSDKARFMIDGLSRAITQGELRLVSSDPYSVDDVRYFTVAVTPPLDVLIVGQLRSKAQLLATALAPASLVKEGRARYHVQYRPASELNEIDFKHLDIVCLVNVGTPGQSTWSSLGEFVRTGGGLLVIAGNDRLAAAAYNGDSASLSSRATDGERQVAGADDPRSAQLQSSDLQEIRVL